MHELETRLDAAESAFFSRQLESIDEQQYEVVYAETKARTLLPTQAGVDEDAIVYTYRMYDHVGQAKIIADHSDDLPSVDVSGAERSLNIKDLGLAYGFSIREIRAAMKGGYDLDGAKAVACRKGINRSIDNILATGNAAHGLTGFLGISGVPSYTLADKSGGGKLWVNATPDEIASDITGIVSARKLALKGADDEMEFDKFSIVMPIDKYTLIAQTRMGDGSDKTILKFVMETSPFIESINSWSKCTAAGGGGTDRMVCYPKDPLVVAALVPQEFKAQPPQQKNLRFVINCTASCGGVVCRYPVAMAYADGL